MFSYYVFDKGEIIPDTNNLLKIVIKSSRKEFLEVEITAFSYIGLFNTQED